MKKIISLLTCFILLLSVISLAGCGAKGTLKFGMGVYTYIDSVSNAEADTNGKGEIVATVAAVLLDKDGKITDCVIDTAANQVSFTSEGKFIEATEFKTKYEKGEAYGMKAYAGAEKEWYEQVDAFVSVVKGKTLEEVKGLMAGDNKGTDDVINAGCTIIVSDFVKAIEKAVANAEDSNATSDDTLKLGIISTQTGCKDATDEAAGVNEVDTTAVAAVLDKDGKVVSMQTDALQGKVSFDKNGIAAVASGDEVTTKKSLGEKYGMAQYGQDLNADGVVKEWFEQAEAFNKICEGKTAIEINSLLASSGYGVEEVQTAGCTIQISDMVKAAIKAATVS